MQLHGHSELLLSNNKVMREAKNSNRENDISNIVLLNNNMRTMLCLNFCVVLLLLLNVNFPFQTLHGF